MMLLLDPATQLDLDWLSQHLIGRGLDPAGAGFAARAVVDRMITAQATMEAFYDAFYFIATVFVLMFPLAFPIARHAPRKFEVIECTSTLARRRAFSPVDHPVGSVRNGGA